MEVRYEKLNEYTYQGKVFITQQEIDDSIKTGLDKLDEINKLILHNEEEALIRELLNRIRTVIRYYESYEIREQCDNDKMEALSYVVDILKGYHKPERSENHEQD